MATFNTDLQVTAISISNCLKEKDLLQNTLIVLEPSRGKEIEIFSMAGASILLPNLALGSQLLVQTIIRQGKTIIATTKELWVEIKSAFEMYPNLLQKIKICLLGN